MILETVRDYLDSDLDFNPDHSTVLPVAIVVRTRHVAPISAIATVNISPTVWIIKHNKINCICNF